MNIFDILNITSRIPWELIQKIESDDLPAMKQLVDLWKQAEPHVNALIPLEKQAQALWDRISPDVQAVMADLKP